MSRSSESSSLTRSVSLDPFGQQTGDRSERHPYGEAQTYSGEVCEGALKAICHTHLQPGFYERLAFVDNTHDPTAEVHIHHQ